MTIKLYQKTKEYLQNTCLGLAPLAPAGFMLGTALLMQSTTPGKVTNMVTDHARNGPYVYERNDGGIEVWAANNLLYHHSIIDNDGDKNPEIVRRKQLGPHVPTMVVFERKPTLEEIAEFKEVLARKSKLFE